MIGTAAAAATAQAGGSQTSEDRPRMAVIGTMASRAHVLSISATWSMSAAHSAVFDTGTCSFAATSVACAPMVLASWVGFVPGHCSMQATLGSGVPL